MPMVSFKYADVKPISLNRKNVLKSLILELFINEGEVLNKLSYVFCSDEYVLEINKKFLGHNYYTDIISFDLSEEQAVTGEIYISTDRVKENAIAYAVAYSNELCRVILHGALHLCGYKDKKKSEIIIMRKKEDYYLQLLNEKLK